MTAPAASLDATLAALADPSRRAVVGLLRAAPRRASDLADELGLSRPAMSRHLRLLRQAGVIRAGDDDGDGRARPYQLELGALLAVRDWIDDAVGFWQAQLASFAGWAEASASSTSAGRPGAAATRRRRRAGRRP
ncbi:MAG: winged helix-turn-helix transcriptional regulator [Kofleriaceae bacterium]|nr:winged helix-turn-helix transcriptional regulator [Kofleriaceae bacterium]MBP6838303.1 winged helix-turn-helix transcriptional regulator [Kofleriaceae bacterium]MBP9206587.1 winged helix-turn-helix transcriptional regulator [Kofleriaceae bacterium]